MSKQFDHFDATGAFLETFTAPDSFLSIIPPAKDNQGRDRTIEHVTPPSFNPATQRLTYNRSGYTIVALTQKEQDAYAATQAAAAESSAFEAAVASQLADLNTLIGTSGTLTGAQLSNAVRGLAFGQKGIIKRVLPLVS